MAIPQYNDYTVSKDGKTVTVNGKKYTRSQFLKTFKPETSGPAKNVKYGADAVTPGAKGTARPIGKSTKVAGTTLKEERQARAAKTPKAGSTRIGLLSTGRGGGAGGMLGKGQIR